MPHHHTLKSEATTISVAAAVALSLFILAQGVPSLRIPVIGQIISPLRTNVFRPQQTELGVVLPAGDHNLVASSGNGTFAVLSYPFTDPAHIDYRTRFWAYEYTGAEPPSNGRFYVSPELIRQQPQYAALSTLTQMQRGRWYYVTTDSDLFFKTGQGIGPAYNAECTGVESPTEAGPAQNVQIKMFLRNTGAAAWLPGRIKLTLRAGTGIWPGQQGENFIRFVDLGQTTQPGAVGEFTFSITTPSTPVSGGASLIGQIGAPSQGAYSVQGRRHYGTLCNVNIRIGQGGNTCPNGRVEGQEACDDGNSEALDGCGPDCRVENGWRCSGTPSRCEPLIPGLGGGGSSAPQQGSSVAAQSSSAAQQSSSTQGQGSSPTGGNGCYLGRCAANLTMSIQNQPDPPQAGGRLDVSVVIRNDGPDIASAGDVRFQFVFPREFTYIPDAATSMCFVDQPGSVFCRGIPSSINAGSTVTVPLKFSTPSTCGFAPELVVVWNDLSSSPQPREESRKRIQLSCPSADVGVTMQAGNGVQGQEWSYTIDVTNTGPGEAQQVNVSTGLSMGMGFTFVRATEPTCRLTNNVLYCGPFNLASGSTRRIVLTLMPTRCDFSMGWQTIVTTSTNDPNQANNQSPTSQVSFQCPSGGGSSQQGGRTGNIYVTKDTVPLRPRQLLGGELGDAILRLSFRADGNEDVDVTDLQFTAVESPASSVDRLELFKEGATTPFVSATVGGCGSDLVPANTFCAKMQNQQLVVPRDQVVRVLARPRMKTDVQGGVSGQPIVFTMAGRAVANNATGEGAVRARGRQTSNNLAANDGDATAEGEIFIGTGSPAANATITGERNVSVMAKITSITNANPDQNGTPVPTGVAPIGQFKFTAAPNVNSQNGLNKVMLTDFIFTVTAPNVALNPNAYKIYDKANPTVKSPCDPLDSPTSPYSIVCWNIRAAGVNGMVDQGGDRTFVLEAIVTNPRVSGSQGSSLQVSLDRFTNPSIEGMSVNQSHIRWVDSDNSLERQFWWFDYPENSVRSTLYQ